MSKCINETLDALIQKQDDQGNKVNKLLNGIMIKCKVVKTLSEMKLNAMFE